MGLAKTTIVSQVLSVGNMTFGLRIPIWRRESQGCGGGAIHLPAARSSAQTILPS
jgi:hypothetical protein